jgi:hypothetical protein
LQLRELNMLEKFRVASSDDERWDNYYEDERTLFGEGQRVHLVILNNVVGDKIQAIHVEVFPLTLAIM